MLTEADSIRQQLRILFAYTLTMTCPLCGGTARSPIAPGYWRCTSLVEKEELAGTAGAADRWLRPTVIQTTRECGKTYVESGGLPGPVCPCGTFAIGLCKKCSRPICGIHSGMWYDARLCGDHYQEKQAERERLRQLEQQAAIVAERERREKEKQERQRAQEDRAARIARSRDQIPDLLAQLGASRTRPKEISVYVKGKWRKRAGWILFEDPRESGYSTWMEPYEVTTGGEFIKSGSSGASRVKNQEAIARAISGDSPLLWEGRYDWAMIADRLRKLISGS
jgi:hypothetical protein